MRFVVAAAALPEAAALVLFAAAVAEAVRGNIREVPDNADVSGTAVVMGRLGGTDPGRAARPTADVVATEEEAVPVGFELWAIRENFVGMGGNVGMPLRLRLFRISVMSHAERLRRNFTRFGTLKVFAGSGDAARTVWGKKQILLSKPIGCGIPKLTSISRQCRWYVLQITRKRRHRRSRVCLVCMKCIASGLYTITR